MEKWPIGVFTSIDAGLGVKFEVAQELGVPTVQLHTPHKQSRTPEQAKAFLKRCDEAGITVTAMFGGFEGESYADIPTVKRTIGLVPLETRAERLAEIKEIADFASGEMGIKVIGMHLGFIPEEKNDPQFDDVRAITQEVCDHLKKNSQALHLETGQESSAGLLQFIEAVGRDNLFVNFDPANMILYGSGEPIAALKHVGRYVRSVHCKDAKWAANPGQEWGQEVPLGEGDVGMENYLRTLDEIGYIGPLTIERETPENPEQQKADIGQAVKLLEGLRAKIE